MQAASPNSVNHSHTRRTGMAYNCKSDTAASDKTFATLTQPVQLHACVCVHAYAFVSDAASDKAQRQRLPLRTCAMTPHQHGGHITSQTRTTYTTTPRIPTRTCCFVRAKTQQTPKKKNRPICTPRVGTARDARMLPIRGRGG